MGLSAAQRRNLKRAGYDADDIEDIESQLDKPARRKGGGSGGSGSRRVVVLEDDAAESFLQRLFGSSDDDDGDDADADDDGDGEDDADDDGDGDGDDPPTKKPTAKKKPATSRRRTPAKDDPEGDAKPPQGHGFFK